MHQGPEADPNPLFAGAERWVRVRAAAPPAGGSPEPGTPPWEDPVVMVAGWEDGHAACAPFASADAGRACGTCAVGLAAATMRTGRAAMERCPFGIRMLAFPAPAGSRTSVAVLRLGGPDSSRGDLPAGAAVLRAARRLRDSGGLISWEAEQRERGAERRRTAAAALAQMISTTEEFHRLWTAADRDRASAENSVSSLDRLARETLRESEEARVGIAHTLHDTAAQSMVSAHRFLEAARSSLVGPHPEGAGRHLDAAQERLLAAIKEIRSVLSDLVPPGLEELGLASAIESHVRDSVPGSISVEVAGDLPRSEYWLEAGLFAMTAEAIGNAVQHGRPTRITIDLRASRGRGIITVTDDGVGFDPMAARRKTNRGMGLIGMQRRAGWLGGRVDVVSRPGAGTTLSIKVPLAEAGRVDAADAPEPRRTSVP